MLREGRRLFGTDGIRGIANTELTPEFALSLGRAAASVVGAGPVLVGRDTRRSGEMLSLALQAGFHSAGVDTIDVGIATSGAISYLTSETEATLGAVVSASHNPAADNGIKFLNAKGTKLSDEEEDEIESRLRSGGSEKVPYGGQVGTRYPLTDAFERYTERLTSQCQYTFHGLSVTLDCANGAAFRAAPEVFRRLKADVEVVGDLPDGVNINAGCGATHPEYLASRSAGRIGLAFDGDADRLIAVDEEGNVVNGDVIMAICARHWAETGQLENRTVVATVMSNLGFRKAMTDIGVRVIETKVGDRYVLEAMRANQAVLGGEQSGHIIFLDRAKTGDGLLTGIRLLEVVAATGRSLVELASEAMTTFPQILENVRVARKDDLERSEPIWEAVRAAEATLGDDGRILVRASGTEPLVRVMVEASHDDAARRYAAEIAAVVAAELGEEAKTPLSEPSTGANP